MTVTLNWKWIGPLAMLAGLLQASSVVNQVSIETRGNYRYVYSNGIPNHATGTFPNAGNPNTISAQDHTYRVPLHPQLTETITLISPAFGVALNGIPFEPGTAEAWQGDRSSPWRFEALTGFINLGLDENNAHVQRTGAYHYHGVPTGLLPHEPVMTHIGYAADGFPVYGPHGYVDANNAASSVTDMHSSYRLKAGLRPDGPGGLHDGAFLGDFEYVAGLGDLDECNGRFGVTPEHSEGIYHYYITEAFPFIPRCVKGIADESFLRRPVQGGPPSGEPPHRQPHGDDPGRRPHPHGRPPDHRPGRPPHPPGGRPDGPPPPGHRSPPSGPPGARPGGDAGASYEPSFPAQP